MLGTQIAFYRKKMNLTQDQLAQRLDVTNQAVSKWETDQCCPDVALLPKLADVFGISLDCLFGRESKQGPQSAAELPWGEDDALHLVVYHGRERIDSTQTDARNCTFHYEGPAKDIYCDCNITCGDVKGNVQAGGYVECSDVDGAVWAGSFVECDDVGGDVNSGSYVECDDVAGSVNSGSYVECGDVGGNVHGSDSSFNFSVDSFKK